MSFTRRSILQSSTVMAGLAALTTLPLSACGKAAENSAGPSVNKASETILDEARELILSSYPETASSFGIDKGRYGALKSKLGDKSLAAQSDIAAQVKDVLARMKSADTSGWDEDQKLHLDVARTAFELTSEGFDFPYGDVAFLNSNWSYRNSPYAVAQNVGAFVDIPSFLSASHSLETASDADSYLERIKGFAAQLEAETARIAHDGAQGVILPDFLMKKTLAQLRSGLSKPSSDWGFVSKFAGKTNGFDGDYGQKAEALAEQIIRPALAAQLAQLEALAPKAGPEAGIWAKPGGEAYYDWALRAGTTTRLTADDVHEIGLEELDALHIRMDKILRSVGYSGGSVGERMTALSGDERYQFSDGDKGRAEIMSFIENAVDDIRGRMPEAFHTLVPGFLEVTRIDPEVEDGAPGAYGGAGSIDGKKPGHFWINLRTPKLHSKFSLADLTYHEAIPGHVWQGEYAFKQPLIRSLLGFNAYSEGWALYAEQLADELGVYDAFPVGRLGYLQSLAFRACRLVVDTGLHAKRWGRAQAIDWFVTHNGSNPDEVQSEVDRYCAWPGQACGYKIGHTAINRLRQRAKAELGDGANGRFDFRSFNDALVLGGNVPMTVLGRVIDHYIASAKSGE